MSLSLSMVPREKPWRNVPYNFGAFSNLPIEIIDKIFRELFSQEDGPSLFNSIKKLNTSFKRLCSWRRSIPIFSEISFDISHFIQAALKNQAKVVHKLLKHPNINHLPSPDLRLIPIKLRKKMKENLEELRIEPYDSSDEDDDSVEKMQQNRRHIYRFLCELAIKEKHIELFKELWKEFKDMDIPVDVLLMNAIENKNIEITELLLSKKVYVPQLTYAVIFHFACLHGNHRLVAESIKASALNWGVKNVRFFCGFYEGI